VESARKKQKNQKTKAIGKGKGEQTHAGHKHEGREKHTQKLMEKHILTVISNTFFLDLKETSGIYHGSPNRKE
jgi:hypothetical protein